MTAGYGERVALESVDLEIPVGSLLAVIGPNGAGKSTLLKTIAGLLQPFSGTVEVLGSTPRLAAKRIAYVPQAEAVDWAFPVTVGDVVLMGRVPLIGFGRSAGKPDREAVAAALETVGMADERDRQIGKLSGGQRRRVFLAKALAARPDLYLLDEPVTGVDVTTQEDLMRILEDESDAGRTVIATTHDLASAAHHFHQAAFVSGRLVAYGPADLVMDPALLTATYGGHVIVLPAGDRTSSTMPTITTRHPAASAISTTIRADHARLHPGPDDVRLHAAWSGRCGPGRHRLRRHGGVRGPPGTGIHRRRGQPRRVSGLGHRVPGRTAAVPRRRDRGRGDRARDRGRRSSGSLRFDTAVGVLFAGMFAFGILLFSSIEGYVADLFGYLLGNVLGITFADIVQIAVLGGAVLVIVAILRKEFLYASFDPAGAAASGLPVATLDYLLLGLIGVTIVVSIQAVGIIMVVAMLVTPAATGQLLVDKFWDLVRIAIGVAIVSAVTGLYLAFYLNVASGASIVLVETLCFTLALLFSPKSGWLRRGRGAPLEAPLPPG